MLGSFKTRMLAIIVIVTVVGLSLQSEHSSRKIIEPAVKFILKDYGWEKSIAAFIGIYAEQEGDKGIPASSYDTLQLPCRFIAVEREYGWFWNQASQSEEFSPGINLLVHEDSKVKPVLSGQVAEIARDTEGISVLIRHDKDIYTFYGGLKEALVKEKQSVDIDTVIGKSGKELYFEVKNAEGPLNPGKLFE